jgi:hypothetical protein
MTHRLSTALLLVTLVAAPAAAQTSAKAASGGTAAVAGALPLEHAPKPTTGAIDRQDLMTRVYIFADDSMMGREAGHEGSVKATAYIAAELQRLGLQPAGDSGTFFQQIPLVHRQADTATRVEVEGAPLAAWTDYIPLRAGAMDAPAVYGGQARDSSSWIAADAARGKIVVLDARGGPVVVPATAPDARFGGAAAVAVIIPDQIWKPYSDYLRGGSTTMRREGQPPSPATMLVTAAAAAKLLGAPVTDASHPGAAGKPVRGAVVVNETLLPARNVVAVLPGSDATMRGQYVALGSHSDHVGYAERPVDHDSLRAFNSVLRTEGAESGPRPGTPEQLGRVRSMIDSLRKLRPARADSIHNGADDDGSGSMAMLEIAEAMATAREKPKRSVLFVWHTAEEMGLLGADWFTRNPTVPRDSIVAQLNMDMIGRGGAEDVKAGTPGYIQLIGSRRLSTELGDLVEAANRDGKFGLAFDYQFDAEGHPNQFYCRSDHYMYARFGIPVTFFSTGGHRDYHMLTDEPQYINYDHYATVTRFIHDVALRVANLDHRPVVDKEKPADPFGACVQ